MYVNTQAVCDHLFGDPALMVNGAMTLHRYIAIVKIYNGKRFTSAFSKDIGMEDSKSYYLANNFNTQISAVDIHSRLTGGLPCSFFKSSERDHYGSEVWAVDLEYYADVPSYADNWISCMSRVPA
ncbi:hypothetical protein IAQ61_007513 [Plenodomus lingam]|uniref:uncharacterized protein n=1 Tax=Leptosphaeria maculans TaxID=5022 RepID=UPI00332F4AE5|nr:hypothetical protein IAQ61_007513 [Plenodomus lingam]